jgi:hypothetical protein
MEHNWLLTPAATQDRSAIGYSPLLHTYLCSHPSHFAGSYFAVWSLSYTEWWSRRWRETSSSSHHSASAKKREKTLKSNKTYLGGGRSIIRGSSLSRAVLEPNPGERQGMIAVWTLIKHSEKFWFILQILVFVVVSSECWAGKVCCMRNYCYAKES